MDIQVPAAATVDTQVGSLVASTVSKMAPGRAVQGVCQTGQVTLGLMAQIESRRVSTATCSWYDLYSAYMST